MKTAAEYRMMAEECFKWAREAKTKENRASLRQLAQIWLDAASKLDGLPATRLAATAARWRISAATPRRRKPRSDTRPMPLEDAECLIAAWNETPGTMRAGHRLGLTSLMDGAAPPLPFQFAPLSSSRPKQLG
jgi:hypothetical protein